MILLWSSSAMAGVINVEFKFTPFVGDPIKSSQVETVPGKASVFVNNVPVAEKQVDKQEVPVLFEEREIAPSVWLPVQSLGPVLRKGKNKIRIEFEPTDSKMPYRAQLRWASVTDQVTKVENGPGHVQETNQSGEGVDDKKTKGVASSSKKSSWLILQLTCHGTIIRLSQRSVPRTDRTWRCL